MANRKKIGAFTPEQASDLITFMREAKAAGVHKRQTATPIPDTPESYRVNIFNDSAEQIPAYACMQVDGTFQLGNQTYIKVIKPDKTDGVYLFNNDRAIYKKSTTNAMPWGVVRMLTNIDDPVFDPGAQFVAVPGQWYIEEGDGPFVGFGPDKNKKKVIKGRIAAAGGGGGTGSMVVFQFDEDEYETKSESVPALCSQKSPVEEGSHRVWVINAPCGGSVQGMDDQGYITVNDPGEFLKDRDYRSLSGKIGFAALMGGEPEYENASGACQWVITWINFFREMTIIQNIIFQEDRIVLKRRKIVVWDDCSLPDEEILGADCDPEEYV